MLRDSTHTDLEPYGACQQRGRVRRTRLDHDLQTVVLLQPVGVHAHPHVLVLHLAKEPALSHTILHVRRWSGKSTSSGARTPEEQQTPVLELHTHTHLCGVLCIAR